MITRTVGVQVRHAVQGFFSGINNLKEWRNNHRGGAKVIIVIPEGCLFH